MSRVAGSRHHCKLCVHSNRTMYIHGAKYAGARKCATRKLPLYKLHSHLSSLPSTAIMSSPIPILPGNRAIRYACQVCKKRHDGSYGSGKYCSAPCVPNFPCEVCSKLHDSSYGSGRFCSSRCSRNVPGKATRGSKSKHASSRKSKNGNSKRNTRPNEEEQSRKKMSVYSLLN